MTEILTERLFLRPPVASDFEAWARFAADPAVMRFIGGAQPRALAWRAFLTMVGAWQVQGFAMFSVIERRTGQWIGRVGPWQPEGWPGTEVAIDARCSASSVRTGNGNDPVARASTIGVSSRYANRPRISRALSPWKRASPRACAGSERGAHVRGRITSSPFM